MYVNPFHMGIFVTVATEAVIIIILAIIYGRRK